MFWIDASGIGHQYSCDIRWVIVNRYAFPDVHHDYSIVELFGDGTDTDRHFCFSFEDALVKASHLCWL